MIASDKIIVIIPTYNNAKTLRGVVDRVKAQGYPVLVVNDGAADDTAAVLSGCEGIAVVSYAQNRGKGYALRTGFRWAIEQGFDYAVTIDSDGQHNPDNISRLVAKLSAVGDCMVLGERNMTQDGVPLKSNFGRRFSNFWFYVDTWVKSMDTQTGFRLYPLQAVRRLKFFTRRFEFEVESLVRIAWENVPVVGVPVDVAYFSGAERVSHFRPFKDFVRISLLNTVLFLAAYCFFLPRLIIKKWRQKGFKEVFFNPSESNTKKALSVALGAFWGIIPIWGFQMVVALSSATALKLNKVLALIASNISIPPAVPFIVFASMWFGQIILGTDTMVPFSYDLTPGSVMFAVLQYVVGSIVLGLLIALVAFAASYLVLKLTRTRRTK